MNTLTKIDVLSPRVQGFEPLALDTTPPPALDFRTVFKNTLSEVNGLDTQARSMVEALATGKTNDVSGVMMAVQKANLSFNMLLQIRNKVIDAYDEIMRMRM